MKARFKIKPDRPAHVFMRSAGYAKYENSVGEESYVRRVTGLEFPRFHVYVSEDTDPVTLSIHLDHKAHSYDGVSAHSGEYDGEVVLAELERLHATIGVPMVLMMNTHGKPVSR